jgi:hypothetical protein
MINPLGKIEHCSITEPTKKMFFDNMANFYYYQELNLLENFVKERKKEIQKLINILAQRVENGKKDHHQWIVDMLRKRCGEENYYEECWVVAVD